MKSSQLRKKFLNFFEEKGHKIVPSSSLATNDPSVLFTTAGMQQFKPYFIEGDSLFGNRVVSIQKCLRTSDIEKVGDESHLTFFEMLGNFSFNDYFKEETIKWAIEFLTEEIGLEKERLWFTYFKGEGKIEKDKEVGEIFRKLEINKKRIVALGREENFWGPTGKEGPCGPTVEIHYDLKPEKNCKLSPNCDRFMEVWNLVFNQYYQDEDNNLSPLKYRGIDTGLGLERLTLICQNKENIFETDLFENLFDNIKEANDYSSRILADHIKAVVFLTAENIVPEKIGQGYILRRLLRRAVREKEKNKDKDISLIELAKKVIKLYKDIYPELLTKQAQILNIIEKEEEAFAKSLKEGIKQFNKAVFLKTGILSGKDAFRLYETYSLPLEIIEELAKKKGFRVDLDGFKRAQEKHRLVSRVGASKKFGGLGKAKKETEAVKLHTATHLLHAVLRKFLGEQVRQMGSDINKERLRFDFSFDRKLTDKELREIESLVNQKIKEDLIVCREEMPLEEAIKSGALSFFKEKYPERVSVYSIGNFSKEICAGPHAKKTGNLGKFKIIQQKAVGAGIRRVKAVLE
jgi:alanyl-tRNA synthetase